MTTGSLPALVVDDYPEKSCGVADAANIPDDPPPLRLIHSGNHAPTSAATRYSQAGGEPSGTGGKSTSRARANTVGLTELPEEKRTAFPIRHPQRDGRPSVLFSRQIEQSSPMDLRQAEKYSPEQIQREREIVTALAVRVAPVIMAALRGHREPGALRQVFHPYLYQYFLQRCQLFARARAHSPQLRRYHPMYTAGRPVVCHVRPGAAEVSVPVWVGKHSRASAMRIEARRGKYLIVGLDVI